MATVRDIVQAAMRKIGVVAIDEPMSAGHGEIGLEAFNAMLHGWKLRSVDIEHTDLGLNDAFPLADEYREGTIYLLAQNLSPDFIVPATFNAEHWFRRFQAAYRTANPVTIDGGLLDMPSQRNLWIL